MFDPLTTVLALDGPTPPDLGACESRLQHIARMRSWLSARQAEVVQQIAGIEAERNPRSSDKRTSDRVKENAGCSDAEARRDTANAGQLGSMESTRDGLSSGRIPVANANALARLRATLDGRRQTAFDADEGRLAELAEQQTPDEFRATLRDWAHTHSGDDGLADHQRRKDNRRLTIGTDHDEMGILRAALDPESTEMVRRAITDVANELWHGTWSAHLDGATHISNNARLMADALVELCRRGSVVGADGGRRARPTVIVTIALDDLINQTEATGITARLADGTPLPAETVRRLACDADLIPAVLGGAGQPLDVGRARRLATDAQRAALRLRYRNCAFRGCDRPFDWCDIHHLHPWLTGGRTDLDNLVPLCNHHHHLTHEGGWQPQRQADDTVVFCRNTDPPPGDPTSPKASGPPPHRGEPPPPRPPRQLRQTPPPGGGERPSRHGPPGVDQLSLV